MSCLPGRHIPSKHQTFIKCWINVGPPSSTLDQHWINIRWASRVCCEFMCGCQNVNISPSIYIFNTRLTCFKETWMPSHRVMYVQRLVSQVLITSSIAVFSFSSNFRNICIINILKTIPVYRYTYLSCGSRSRQTNSIQMGKKINSSDNVTSYSFNPLTARLLNLNFHPLEVVSRWRDPQLQVSENYSYLTKFCWLMSRFICNMFEN